MHRLHLMSDLHIGSPHTDYDLIAKELRQAKDSGARIAINGDVFDFILPSDRKRFRASALHPRLYGTDDVVGACEEWALEILGPYADIIDLIGDGNHEDSNIKYHHRDSVRWLVKELNRMGGNVAYGGYCGFYSLSFKEKPRRYWRYTIYRHHGAGGSSPVTKGMIDFERMMAWVEGVDALWIGHKHNRFVDNSRAKVRMTASGEIEERPVRCVMTGAYMTTYENQSVSDALKAGRRGNYAEAWNIAPQNKGGVTLEFTMRATGLEVSAAV